MQKLQDATVLTPHTLLHETSTRRSTGEALGEVAHLSPLAGLSHLRGHHEFLEPGRRASASHSHSAREEIVYVLSGNPTLRVGDDARRLNPGDVAALRPSDVPHVLCNESEEVAEMLVVSATPEEDIVTFHPG